MSRVGHKVGYMGTTAEARARVAKAFEDNG